LGRDGFEVEMIIETEIGIKESRQVRTGHVPVVVWYMVPWDELPFKELVQMCRQQLFQSL
jgi:hypothetical protein